MTESRFSGAAHRRFPDIEVEGPWSFVQLADSQFGLLNQQSEPDNWKDERECLDLAIKIINSMVPAPKFVVVCGDLVNEFKDAKRAHRQVEDFKSSMSRVDGSIRLVCVCGNHDVGDVPTRESIQLFESRFGEAYGEFFCGNSTRCLVLNTQLYSGETAEMAEEQDSWIQQTSTTKEVSSSHNLLVFSHIPPFIFDEDEPKGYFNLDPEPRRRLIEKIKSVPARHKAWFCGHFHRNAGNRTKDKKIDVVVTSAVGTAIGWNDQASAVERLGIPGMDWAKRQCCPSASGFRIVVVDDDDQIRHRFFTLDDISQTLAAAHTHNLIDLSRQWRTAPIFRSCRHETVPQLIEAGEVEMLELLVRTGHIAPSQLGMESELGLTPAYLAVRFDRPEILRFLSRAGVDLSKKCDDYATPAFYAAYHGNVRILETLARLGVDLKASCTRLGDRPCDFFKKHPTAIYDMLVDAVMLRDRAAVTITSLLKGSPAKRIFRAKQFLVVTIQRRWREIHYGTPPV